MNEIFEYVRGRKGQLRGVVLATTVKATTEADIADQTRRVVIGWSQANESKGDRFNKQTALSIARTRALNGPPGGARVPRAVLKITKRLEQRALTYFKGAVL